MALDYIDFKNGDIGLDIRNKLNTFNNSVVHDVNKNTTDIETNRNSILNIGKVWNLTPAENTDIDQLWQTGIYEVSTNLPYGWTSGELTVQHFNGNTIYPNKVIQRLTDIFTQETVERTANDYLNPSWDSWVDITPKLVNLQDVDTTNLSVGSVLQWNGSEWETKFIQTYDYTKVSNHTVTGDTYENIAILPIVDRNPGVYEVKFSGTYTLDTTTRSAYIRFSLDDGLTWNEFRREPKDNTDKLPFYYAFPKDFNGTDTNIIVQMRKESASDILEVFSLDVVFERKA